MKRTALALTVAAAVPLLLTACGSSTESADSTASCPKPSFMTDDALKPAFNDLQAQFADYRGPDGSAQITAVKSLVIRDQPGKAGVSIAVCDPKITSADELRPTATDIAKKLKALPQADRIATVWVESYQVDGDDVVNDVKVKDADFQLHLWDGRAAAGVEDNNWEVLQG